jgi:benzoyl-CoA reductase/2-hydroxyglutaryl-CoA dehydratase subunit BcrC/BadD/HgdB
MEQAGRAYGCEYFLIDVPQESGEAAIDYVAIQLEGMAIKISELTGLPLSREKLVEAIRISNHTREYALWVNKLRQSVPAPMRGSEALGYLYLTGMAYGSTSGLKIYKTMADELERRVARKHAPLGEEKHRLLWLHLRPFFRNRIFRYLEKERKAAIAFEEINHVYWPELDPERPYWSVAQRMVSNFINDPIESSLALYFQLIKDYKIDGVIQLAHWGCRWNYGRIKILKEAFQEKGIPFMSLDCDLISERNFNETQIKSRLDTFLDMLE